MCQCQILVTFAVVDSFIFMWRTINAVETGKAMLKKKVGLQLASGRFYRVEYSRYCTIYNYFILFCATVKTITPEVLWMTR